MNIHVTFGTKSQNQYNRRNNETLAYFKHQCYKPRLVDGHGVLILTAILVFPSYAIKSWAPKDSSRYLYYLFLLAVSVIYSNVFQPSSFFFNIVKTKEENFMLNLIKFWLIFYSFFSIHLTLNCEALGVTQSNPTDFRLFTT